MIASITTTKVCPGCNYELPIAYFHHGRILCDFCRDAITEGAPWTAEDISRLRKAASKVNSYFVVHYEGMTEREREHFRRLIDASDRRTNRKAI